MQQLSAGAGFLSSSSASVSGGGFFKEACFTRALFLAADFASGCCSGVRRFLDLVLGPLRVSSLEATLDKERECSDWLRALPIWAARERIEAVVLLSWTLLSTATDLLVVV
jgi:hypothetical protein